MNEQIALDLARDAVLTLLTTVAPIMVIALVAGLTVALFQALTQIQEMTLAFVPKILIVFGALLILLPFMLATLRDFFVQITDLIIGLPVV